MPNYMTCIGIAMRQTLAEAYEYPSRAAKEWLEANKEDIERRVTLFKAAHSTLCKQYGLRVTVHYERMMLFTDAGDLGSIWVANLYD